jgi:uncharacterized protein YqgC (DUF456 family)
VSPLGEVLVGVVVAVGLVGVVVQVLPGALLAVLATVAAEVGKYLLAGRHLRRAGVPPSTLVWGGLVGIVGFFVVPVVGLPVGFLLGTYLAELVRHRDHATAWRATVAALQATGLTILVELAGALVSTGAWVAGLLVT